MNEPDPKIKKVEDIDFGITEDLTIEQEGEVARRVLDELRKRQAESKKRRADKAYDDAMKGVMQ